MKFLVDANFIMIPGEFGIDIFSELEKFGKPELYTTKLVVKELKRISETKKGKDSRNAGLALELIKKKGVTVLKSTEKNNTDKELIEMASKGFVICTQDKKMIEKLKQEGKPVICLRQKKYLVKV